MESIKRYIAERADPETALAFTDRIIDRCLAIGDVPLGGTPRDELGTALRSVPFEQSVTIVYRVRKPRVEIVGIFYGGRDIVGFFARRRRS